MTDRIEELIARLKYRYIISVTENRWKYSNMFEHTDGSYKIIDWGDRDNPRKLDIREAMEDPKCQVILKCQLRPNSPDKLRPFFFYAKSGRRFAESLPNLRQRPKKSKKLYWRGNPHMDRAKILNEIGSTYLNHDYMETRNKNVYFREIANSKIMLSLRGWGMACHREFEGFGIGTPVLMPKYDNIYLVNIIPDYHYILIEQQHGEMYSEAIKRRYNEVINDEDFLYYIRRNAMDYYDSYCAFHKSVDWMELLLEL